MLVALDILNTKTMGKIYQPVFLDPIPTLQCWKNDSTELSPAQWMFTLERSSTLEKLVPTRGNEAVTGMKGQRSIQQRFAPVTAVEDSVHSESISPVQFPVSSVNCCCTLWDEHTHMYIRHVLYRSTWVESKHTPWGLLENSMWVTCLQAGPLGPKRCSIISIPSIPLFLEISFKAICSF